MIRALWCIFIASMSIFGLWLMGFDLTHRGTEAGICFFLAVFCFLWSECFPGKYPGEK